MALRPGCFGSGQKGDVNVRGAYLHMLTDALVSAGVVVGGALVLWTGWLLARSAHQLRYSGPDCLQLLGLAARNRAAQSASRTAMAST